MARLVRKMAGDTVPEIFYRVGWTLFFALVWIRAIQTNEAGGIDAGHVNIWGDWAIHFTMGSAMAYRVLVLTTNPLLIGSPFNYPFFVNFLSAILVRAGLPFFASFTIPSFFFSLFFIWALPQFFSRLLGSIRAGLIASLVFMFDGGLGFVRYIQDVLISRTPLFTATHPVSVYTNLPNQQLHWTNVVESMIIPQRAFQLGFPWMIVVMAAVLKARGLGLAQNSVASGRWQTPRRAAILGALYGFLPIVHTHAFACGGLVLIAFCLWDAVRIRGLSRAWLDWWASFLIGALIVSVPVLLVFFSHPLHQSAMKWRPGWYAAGWRNWVWFWWINWGPALLASCVGLGLLWFRMRGRRRELSVFLIPFAALFALANLFVVHSWIWDNTKYLIWVSVGVSALVAAAVDGMWGVTGRAAFLLKPAAILAMVLVCLTGFLDVYRITLPSLNTNQIYSNEDLFLADWAKKNSEPDSIWLTGDSHNNWLYNLTGRRVLETYVGWLWTHGYDYQEVDADVETMYRHPERDDLFRKYNVQYILIGRYEEDSLAVDTQGFDRRFPVEIRTDDAVVYRYVKAGEKAPKAVTMPVPPLPLTVSLRPGLVRRTYRGTYFFGKALIKEGDSDINFNYGPDDVKPFPVPGSVEWEGYLRVPSQKEYRFSVESDDGAWLTLDGVDVIDNGGSHAAQVASATITLTEGYHRFRLRYFDKGGSASLKFGWTAIGGGVPGSEGLFY